jgi:hypothetical protein
MEVGAMPKEIITYGEFQQGESWTEVRWNRDDTVVHLGVRKEDEPNDTRYAYLDRAGVNKLIRVLRRARDQAFGADA